jgi:PAS domain S-box-containing protein
MTGPSPRQLAEALAVEGGEVLLAEPSRSLAEGLPWSVAVLDGQRRFVRGNAGARAFFGREGMACHRGLRGRGEPCEGCPAGGGPAVIAPGAACVGLGPGGRDGVVCVFETVDWTALGELLQVLEQAPISIFAADRDFVVRYVNRAFVALHGGQAGDYLGRHLGHVIEPAAFSRFHAAALAALDEGRPNEEEVTLVHGGRERQYLATRLPLLRDGLPLGVCGMLTDITDLRTARQELEASRRRYQAIVEDQTELVARLDPALRRTFVNANLAAHLGAPAESLLGGCFGDRLPEAEALAFRRRLLELTPRAPTCEVEHAIVLPSGEERRLRWSVRAIFDEAGRIGEYQALGRDVSAVRRMERKLFQSEAKYRDIFEHSAEGIFQFEPSGAVAACNPALARILGYASPEAVLAESGDLFTRIQARQEDRLEFLRQLARHDRVYDFEMQVVRRDGRAAWLSVNARAVLDGDGRLSRVEGAARDITDRKRAEGERMLLVSAVDQSAEGLVIVSRDFRLEYANPAFAQIVAGGQGMVGRDALDALLAPFLTESVRKMLGLGLRWSGRLRLTRPGGEEAVAEALISPVRDAAGQVVNHILLVRDMTYELDLERRLRQAEKLEAIGVLAAGVAHDFNNILTPILLNSELVLCDLPVLHPLRKPLSDVVLASERARDLVRQLLAFSRQGEIAVSDLPLAPLVKETAKLVRGMAPAGVELRLDVAGGPYCVRADPAQMHQVLVNLCLNGVQAMPGGGRLEVGLAQADGPPQPVSGGIVAGAPLTTLAAGPYVRLWVEDAGHGMAPEVAERVFEPFFTTKKPGQGTGMGLAVVHGIVKSCGGAVILTTAQGKGSRFEVYLPRAAGPDACSAKPADGASL